jgi:hypothetical protein
MSVSAGAAAVTVSVASSSPTGSCAGSSVTLTATGSNGGAGPVYAWKLNGTTISGETSSTLTRSNFANNDSVTCTLTSNSACILGSATVSNGFKLKVNPGENYDATLPSIYAVKFKWNNAVNVSQERLFVHVKNNTGYQKAKSIDFQWEIKVVDTIQKTAVIKINTSKLLQDLWFSSLKLGVKYDQNFISILPGEHLIQISYKGDIPVKEDFILNWR